MTAPTRPNPLEPLAQRERVELILSQLDRLPPLPAVAARLLQLTSSDDSSVGDVVPLIESDAALTAAILRMAQRADLGVRGDMMTVGQAVVLIGFSTVRNAVLAVQIFDALGTTDAAGAVSPTRVGCWRHNLAVACAAEMIATQTSGKKAGADAFICGLLHDVGKLALAASLPKSYARVVDKVERDHVCICEVERELFGLDHTVAGKRLATRWRLPQAVVECAWLHHQGLDALPNGLTNRALVEAVILADNLVRQQRIGYSGYQYLAPVETLAEQLGLSCDALADIVAALPGRMDEIGRLVGLGDNDGDADRTRSVASVNRELAELNAQLAEANRRLRLRSACFDALGRFTGGLQGHDRVAEICRAASDAVRWLLSAEHAAGFVLIRGTRCAHVGTVHGRGKDGSTSITDLGTDQAAAVQSALQTLAPTGGIVRVGPALAMVWQRCFDRPPRSELWVLPIADSHTTIGAVVCDAEASTVGRFAEVRSHCAALSAAIGLAASSAIVRAKRERMNEELLDVNRRFRAAQAEIVRARSVSMVAKMAGGAAHELNNPLAVISGRAQLLRNACDTEAELRDLDTIIAQARRASDIVLDLMRFARPDPAQPVVQRLGDVLESACQHWRAESSLRPEQITVALADDDVTVYADRGQLQDILQAVIGNAVDASDAETAALKVNSPSRVSDDMVRIVVEDNGVGMPRDVLEHALDPFFSSRPAGRGRGLGLSRAYRFADINGGRLWLQSTPEVGTTVTIELPARAPRDDVAGGDPPEPSRGDPSPPSHVAS